MRVKNSFVFRNKRDERILVLIT